MTDIMKLHDAAVAAAIEVAARSLGDRDQKTRAALQAAIEALQAERDALAAELAALKAQEPIGFVIKDSDYTNSIIREQGGHYTQPVYAAPKALEPLTDEQSATLFQAVKDDPRSAKFSVQNWFTCGLVTAEAAHGITKGTP